MKINVSRVYFNVHKKNPDDSSARRENALLECLSENAVKPHNNVYHRV